MGKANKVMQMELTEVKDAVKIEQENDEKVSKQKNTIPKRNENKNVNCIQFNFNLKLFLSQFGSFSVNDFSKCINTIISDENESNLNIPPNMEGLIYNDNQVLNNTSLYDISNGCFNFSLFTKRKIKVLGDNNHFVIDKDDLEYFHEKFMKLFFSQTNDMFIVEINKTIQSLSNILCDLSNKKKAGCVYWRIKNYEDKNKEE